MYTASPYKVAIVGGIGSGKSVVSRLFRLMGVPVYDCDTEAKLLMNADPSIRQALKAAIGEQVYVADGRLDRAFLASYMFGHPERVALVNGIVHPAVRAHFSACGCRDGYPLRIGHGGRCGWYSNCACSRGTASTTCHAT